MNKKILRQAAQYQKRSRGHKVWKKTVTVLGAIVVFITTYMLILPAITLEPRVICGVEEHEHGTACYELMSVEESTAELICSPVHVHSEECQGEDGSLICGLSDITVHSHSEDCYYGGELICSLDEIAEHIHTEECLHTETTLICTAEGEDHMHGSECFATSQTLICNLPEVILHSHTDDCYVERCLTEGCTHEECTELTRQLICDQPVLEEHIHIADCLCVSVSSNQKEQLICKKEEHIHIENCLEYPVDNAEEGISHKDVNAWAELAEQPGFFMRRTAESGTPAQNIGGALDLTGWINDVTAYRIVNENRILIEDGSTVNSGDLIEFKLEYTVPGKKLATLVDDELKVETNTVIYTLPTLFGNINNDTGNIYNSFKEKVGSYEIDNKTKTVVMVFEDTYVAQNAGGMQIHGYVSFFSTIERLSAEDNARQDYLFSDKVSFNLNVHDAEAAVGDLRVKKIKGAVDGNLIGYTVTVHSDTGTSSDIILSDEMTGGLAYLPGSLEITDHSGASVEFTEPTGKNIALTLPALQAGGAYTLTYSAVLDKEFAKAEITVDNKVTVSAENSAGQPLSDSKSVSHTFTLLEKEGTAGAEGQVDWTVTVNRAGWDISGWTLGDSFSGREFNGPVTIKDSAGNIIANNAALPYTFSEGSDDTYTVTYTTTHEITEGYRVSNSVSLGSNIVCEAEADVGPPVTKSGEVVGSYIDSDANRLANLRWTVAIDVTNTGIPAGVYIYDKLDGNSQHSGGEADHYLSYDQLTDAIEALTAAIESAGGSVGYWDAAGFVPGVDSYGDWYSSDAVEADKSRTYERFRVTLDKAIPAGHSFTFSYETTGILPDTNSTNAVYKSRINIAEAFETYAEAYYSSGSIDAEKIAMVYKPKYEGNDPDWNEEYGEHTEIGYNDMHDGYLAWQIDINIPADYKGTGELKIFEDLPDGLSVAKIVSRSTSHVPLWEKEWAHDGSGMRWWIYTDAENYLLPEEERDESIASEMLISTTADGDIEFTLSEEIIRLHADFAKCYGLDEMKMYIFIYTEIDDDLQWQRCDEEGHGSLCYHQSFENSFTMTDADGNILDSGKQTQSVRKDERGETVIKSAFAEDNIVSYSIVLNQHGRDLIPNSDKIAVEDVLSYESTADKYLRANLLSASVKLYRLDGFDENGDPVRGEEIPFTYFYDESKRIFLPPENGYEVETTKRNHNISLSVPDETPMLFEYSYSADGDETSHSLFNECFVNGVGRAVIKGNTSIDVVIRRSAVLADVRGAIICKLDAEDSGKYLGGAHFDLYIWREEEGRYVSLTDPEVGGHALVTAENGMFLIDSASISELSYNTAYYLVEVKAPDGYFLDDTPYYFYIKNDDTEKFPYVLPDDFDGEILDDGERVYLRNRKNSTSVTVEKHWQNHNGNEKSAVSHQSITVRLWQMTEGDPKSKQLWDSYTITPDQNGKWSLTVTDLPKARVNDDGTAGADYLYYIEEDTLPGYIVIYKNNEGINFGTITLINRDKIGYDLPKTGGKGTYPYTMGGTALTVASLILLFYKRKRHRKEGANSS